MRRSLRAARLALLWERLWPALWPPLGVAGLFIALALFDALPLLPPWLHALVLAGFALAAVLLLVRGLLGVRPPTVGEARHRLERDNALAHHPLDALADRLPSDAAHDAAALTLWQAHRRRMAAAVRRLRVALPEPGLPARDPWGLRAAVLLLLVIALAGTWNADPWGRVARAVTPAVGINGAEPAAVQVWLTPPEYTRQAPIFLQSPDAAPPGGAVSVPEGTRALVAVQGGHGEAELRHADERLPLQDMGTESWRGETTLRDSGTLAVHQGLGRVAAWEVTVEPDHPPRIALLAAAQDDRARLVLDYEVADDYDLRAARVRLHRPEPEGGLPVPESDKRISLPLPTGGKAARQSWHDLTAHAWAGLPVTLHPEAEDGAGQVGTGEAMEVVLPERQFRHPVARDIIALRRELARDPGRRPAVIEGLDGLSQRPGRFGHDNVVFLSLRVARARLAHDGSVAALVAARELMWDAALRLEEGEAAVAERTLQQAQEELREALESGASDEEIEALMDRLQAALENYMEALAREMARRGVDPAEAMPQDMPTVSPHELSEMVERMREMARAGARDAAREMLAQLEEMLRGIQPGMQAMQGEAAEQMQQAQQALSELQDIARQQRQLLDESHQQQGRQEPDAEAMAEGAEAQEALRRQLGEAMRQMGESLGEIPPSLGEAEQDMRGAAQSLQAGDAEGAGAAQTQALEHLQQGARQAMRAMQRQMAGQGMMPMPGGMGQGRDPLGRRQDGFQGYDDRAVGVPEEGELHRAHEILEELRRRAAEPQRPEDERDYLRRLLERF